MAAAAVSRPVSGSISRPASASVSYGPLPPPISSWSSHMSGLSWALLNPALPDGEIVDKFMEDTSTSCWNNQRD